MKQIDFLRLFNAGPHALYTISPNGGLPVAHPVDADTISDVVKSNEHLNVYFSPAKTKTTSKKCLKSELVGVQYLWTDIDPQGNEDSTAFVERTLPLLQEKRPSHIPAPSIIVFSGGGLQVFWKLSAPLALPQNQDAVENANRWLSQHYDADNCHNVDRIMRMPGTINHPDAKKVAKGRVKAETALLHVDEKVSYELSAFGTAQAVSSVAIRNIKEVTPEFQQNYDLAKKYGVSQRTVIRIMYGDDLNENTNEPLGGDISNILFSIIKDLSSCQVPEAIITAVLLDSEHGIADYIKGKSASEGVNPEYHVARQIARTSSKVSAVPKGFTATSEDMKDLAKKLQRNFPVAANSIKSVLKDKAVPPENMRYTLESIFSRNTTYSPESLVAELKCVDLLDFAKELQAKAHKKPEPKQDSTRKLVVTKGPVGVEVAQDHLTAMISDWAAKDPDMYVVSERLCRWSSSLEELEEQSTKNLTATLNPHFTFCSQMGEGSPYMGGDLPDNKATKVLAYRRYAAHGVRKVKSISRFPVVSPDGMVLGDKAEHNAKHEILFPNDFDMHDMSVQEAYDTVYDVFNEFPDSAIPGALSLLFTSLTRCFLPTAPMHYIAAHNEGSGKTLLASTCLSITQGRIPAAFGQPRREEEFEKLLDGYMLSNPGSVFFMDNWKGTIDYTKLDVVLTSDNVTIRRLGASEQYSMPTNFMSVITGNNLVFSDDINRRLVTCWVDPNVEAVAERSMTRDEDDLKAFVADNHTKILSAVITMLIDAMQNATQENSPIRKMGSFSKWCNTVARPVAYCVSQLQEQGKISKEVKGDITPNKVERSQLSPMAGSLQELYAKYQNGDWKVAGLDEDLLEGLASFVLPDYIAEVNVRKIATNMAKFIGKKVSIDGATYELKRSNRQRHWKVVLVAGTPIEASPF